MSGAPRTLYAAFFSILCLSGAHAADTSGRLTEELSKQQSIYQGHVPETVEGYTVDRALSLYADGLASGFDDALAKLGPADRWLDVGAGQGEAILDYYTSRAASAPRVTKASAVAMSIEDRRTPRWQQTEAKLGEQIRYLSGKSLREYSTQELGRFQLITDVIGGFSYSHNLSLFMEKVLGALEVNGSFFTVLQDVRREDGSNLPFYPGAPYLTEIVDSGGGEVRICEWLKQIGCARVTCESREWQPPTEAYRITKTCDDVSVPALEPLHYKAGTPPERRFRLKSDVSASR